MGSPIPAAALRRPGTPRTFDRAPSRTGETLTIRFISGAAGPRTTTLVPTPDRSCGYMAPGRPLLGSFSQRVQTSEGASDIGGVVSPIRVWKKRTFEFWPVHLI
jgi:hypothetical protein